MLTSISLANFKPFKAEQKARLAPLTLIYGPNSSGKSSIIQSLLLLQQSKESQNSSGHSRERGPLNPAGPGHNFGSIRALLHGQKKVGSFKIGIEWEFDDSVLTNGDNPNMDRTDPLQREPFSFDIEGALSNLSCELTFRLSQQENEPNKHWLDRVDFGFGETSDEFDKITLRQPVTKSPIEPSGYFQFAGAHSRRWLLAKCEHEAYWGEVDDPDDSDLTKVLELIGSQLKFSSMTVGASLLPHMSNWNHRASNVMARLQVLDGTGHYFNSEQIIKDILRGVNQSFQNCLDDVIYLGPLRTPTPRGQIFFSDFGVQNQVGVDGVNTAPVFYQAPVDIKNKINKVFRDMGLNYQIVIENTGDRVTGELLSLLLRYRKNDPVSRTTEDVGFGVSQILPILIQGQISSQKTILVEQPEIHLHPKLQAQLANFFVDTCNQNKNQWIIETHSELLLLRLKRHIRAGRINVSDVCVLYVDPDKDSPQSEILELKLNEQGEFLDEWPDGFFEESYKEMQE